MVPAHWRVVYRGQFESTPETWSHSHNLDPVGSDLGLIDMDALSMAWRGLASVVMHSSVLLTDIRVYRIGTDNRMIDQPRMLTFGVGAEPRGGVGGSRWPSQVALAITTQGANRGPGRFGRFYLPGPRLGLGSDGRMGSAEQENTVDASRTFLLALRDAVALPYQPDYLDAPAVNVSALGNNGAGTLQRVVSVRVGRVYDTIRSRRTSLPEDYVARALS